MAIKDWPKKFTLDLVMRLSLYILVFLTPLFFLPWGVYKVSFNKQAMVAAFVLIALFSYLGKSLNEGKLVYKKGGILILGFLGALVISLIFSLSLNASLFGFSGAETDSFINLLSFILIFLITSVAFKEGDLKKIILTYLSSTALLLIYQFLQLFGVFILPFPFTKAVDFNPVGTIYDFLFVSGANLILILSILVNVELSKIQKRLLSILAFAIFVYLLLINYSYIWLFLAFSMIAVLVLKLYHQAGAVKTKGQNLLIIILAIFIFLSFANLNLAQLSRYFQFNIPPSISLNTSQSAKILKASYASGIKNIVLGSGPATFSYQYLKFKPSELNADIFYGLQRISDFWKIRFNAGYSLVLTYLVTLGILTTILFLLFSLSLVAKSYKSFILPFFVYIILTFLFYNPTYLLVLMFFGGAGIYKALSEETKEINLFATPQRIFLLSFIIIVLMVGSLFALYYEGQRFVASNYYDLGLQSLNLGKLDEALEKMVTAVSWDKRSDEYYRGLSQIFLTKVTSPLAAQTDIPDAINTAQSAINLNNVESLNYVSFAKVYETLVALVAAISQPSEQQKENLTNSYNLALTNYKKAAKYDPKNPEIQLNMAGLHLAINNLEEAKKSANDSLALKSDYSDAYFLLSQVLERENELKEALDSAQKAKLIRPADTGILFQLGNLYYKDNQLDLAQTEFENIITLFPNHSNSRYFLGLVYDKKGQKDKAIEQFEKILALNPDNEEVKKILENLRAGKPAL